MLMIDTLPKIVVCENEPYSLSMHVTAWGKLCLCYKKMFPSMELKDNLKNTIFSQVVEPDMTAKPEFSECIYDIVDVPDFEQAVNMIWKRIKDGFKRETITAYDNE